ncbi:Sensor kinase CusS [Granulosicoccus antarcticus IMCC3135]|uniref:histidine kinase n=2 Tax=Granulosicoccus TaxID=437504 RepID=A0A2Z2NXU9_9GAMM|nr:Sensor kinase CusS [Granulosicoccus antarcticus IMCC3135]
MIFAALSAIMMSMLLAVLFWSISSLLERHIDETIVRQHAVLKDDLAQNGMESMLELIRLHAKYPASSSIHLLALNSEDRYLAGDLPLLPPVEGWQNLEKQTERIDENSSLRSYRALGTRFDDGTFVLVSEDIADLVQTRRLLLQSFSITLAVTVALSLFGGLFIGNVLLRRVESVNQIAQAIMNGDLSQRIPLVGRHDELGGLAESLNRMLARIDDLMQNLRAITSNIAHDLRSPLSRHRQRLELSRMKERSLEEYRAVIDTAIEDTDSILKTFEAMLRIAQIEAGTLREHFAQVELDEIADNIVDAFQAVADDEGKELCAHVESDCRVMGDRVLLTQLISNLIENALRHTPVGTHIRLDIERYEGKTRIVLSDTGPGIPEKERERVFRHFYRLDASRSTPGNGIGLSFVAAVVKAHDATIELDDNEPGLKVTITFS